MRSPFIELEVLGKAIKAERRNGHTNAGVMGGFADFLLQNLARISSHALITDKKHLLLFARLKDLGINYLQIPQSERYKSLNEIEKLLVEIKKALDNELARPVSDTTVEKRHSNPSIAINSTTKSGKLVSIQYLKHVGPERAKLFAKLGITTVEDLLNHFPRRYEDRRNVKTIAEVLHGEVETVRGKVISHQELKPRPRLKIIKILLSDASGSLEVVWFNNPYLIKQMPRGTELYVTGKVERRFGHVELAATDYEVIDEQDAFPGIVPVYPATDKLTSKTIRGLIKKALEQVESLYPEFMNEQQRLRLNLLNRIDAYRQIHFPTDYDLQERAQRRLVFEELFLLQLGILQLRSNKEIRQGIPMQGENLLVNACISKLPFKLTGAQQRVSAEVFADLARPHPMARLVQGDVGSGKTIIAALALLKTVECGYQGAMMAPTEILAAQHFEYLVKLFEPYGQKIEFLSGSVTGKERERILQNVESGDCSILVGTHALIQEAVRFNKLGLAVTDEQHRFGVRQRAELQQKGNNPHVLIMTATPIPRTLALTLYGDLNISVINEMPPGRKEIKTMLISDKSRSKLFRFLSKEMAAGQQVYIVCPLVEESEVLDLRAAVVLAEDLANIFPQYQVGLVHGRMKASEKDKVINDFRRNEIQMLVSTTVIEVGVNVPNASVMVVEGAERFGLAQLHQLRGRVGRGEYQSFCFLVSNSYSLENRKRLSVLTSTNDGFRIAEEDLKIRGPGEFFGTRQHGLPELKIADIVRDAELLELAKVEAEVLLVNCEPNNPNRAIFDEAKRRFDPAHLLGG